MQALIAECARQKPHADWQALREIDYGMDAERLSRWPAEVYREVDEATDEGLWIGLVQQDYDSGTVADAYTSAAPNFAAGSIGWMTGLSSVGDDQYLNSQVLHAIYRLAMRHPELIRRSGWGGLSRRSIKA
jgi:hypothetical protein